MGSEEWGGSHVWKRQEWVVAPIPSNYMPLYIYIRIETEWTWKPWKGNRREHKTSVTKTAICCHLYISAESLHSLLLLFGAKYLVNDLTIVLFILIQHDSMENGVPPKTLSNPYRSPISNVARIMSIYSIFSWSRIKHAMHRETAEQKESKKPNLRCNSCSNCATSGREPTPIEVTSRPSGCQTTFNERSVKS